MAIRPNEKWQQQVEEQAAELASGELSPDDAYAAGLWPESLRARTDAALADFESELAALKSSSDDDILGVVRRVVLALNIISDDHNEDGLTSYETEEREDLCGYINASLAEFGIDVQALERRNGIVTGDIAGEWRSW
jgi:hypothetical protein